MLSTFNLSTQAVRDGIDFHLNRVLKKEKDKFIYRYDFGDGREHEVILVKIN